MESFTAMVRPPGTRFPQAISDHPQKKGIDQSRALIQHRSYVDALKQAGGKILSLPPEDLLPDSTFVEDTAFVFGETAFLCSAKEETRRNEVESVAQAFKDHLRIAYLEPYIDGGDILNTPQAIYIGLSKRSNARAIQSLSQKVEKEVIPVPVVKGLHLKSAVSYLGNNILLIDPARVESSAFKSFQWIKAEEKDSYAANCLALGNRIIMPAGFPTIREKILQHDFETVEVEMSEFEKADGGVTCLSIIFLPAVVRL
jgi:dimethylargininase